MNVYHHLLVHLNIAAQNINIARWCYVIVSVQLSNYTQSFPDVCYKRRSYHYLN